MTVQWTQSRDGLLDIAVAPIAKVLRTGRSAGCTYQVWTLHAGTLNRGPGARDFTTRAEAIAYADQVARTGVPSTPPGVKPPGGPTPDPVVQTHRPRPAIAPVAPRPRKPKTPVTPNPRCAFPYCTRRAEDYWTTCARHKGAGHRLGPPRNRRARPEPKPCRVCGRVGFPHDVKKHEATKTRQVRSVVSGGLPTLGKGHR
jgi:hypothetical protein